MALHLNNLFQVAPAQFLERTVVFANQVNLPGAQKITYFADLEPMGRQARLRVLQGQHEYQSDAVLSSYFLTVSSVTSIKREDPPNRFVFMPEFTNCRLLVSRDGEDYLRLYLEDSLARPLPPPEAESGSRYVDSFGYWDHMPEDLLGTIRGTAVLFKSADRPWTITMQQIVGNPGIEFVHRTYTRALKV